MALLLSYSEVEGQAKTQTLLKKIFETIQALNPSKNAIDYWLAINKTMLTFSEKIAQLWDIEKGVAIESIAIAKEEALTFLTQEREKIMRMSHAEALNELVRIYKIDNRIRTISSISDNRLFTLK